MTLPFENDTNPIVKKISKRNLKADKSRNVLIIITIALATCLIMATALYFLGSQRKSLNDAMGRYQAVINDIDNDKILKESIRFRADNKKSSPRKIRTALNVILSNCTNSRTFSRDVYGDCFCPHRPKVTFLSDKLSKPE